MLQQTSVSRVVPKFEAFMGAFPEPVDLAHAPLGDALALWEGLGYPRRCRNLQRAARAIVDDHGGCVPQDLDDLLALPGVGAYTARAVLAFAHRVDVGVVDTNVSRVVSRLDGRSMTARELQERADELVPSGLAWEWNQVVMDLGARVCTARSPRCDDCPVRTWCAWQGHGDDPAPASAGASRPQARFEGSDRQARGKAVRALTRGECSFDTLVEVMGVERDRAARLLAALVTEGLAVDRDGLFSVPERSA